MHEDDWITTDEAAELSGYSVHYIRRLLRQGEIRSRKFGRTWVVSRQSLIEYLTTAEQSGDDRRGPRGE